MRKSIAIICLALMLSACGSKGAVSTTPAPSVTPDKLLYKDPYQPVDVRVEDLLGTDDAG